METDRLSLAFNGMLERLEVSFAAEKEAKEQMRRFIADASHELRTPLTSIHGFLEVLLRGAASKPEQLAEALNSMYGESERMNKLVQDLLFLTKIDRAELIHMREARLDEVVCEMEKQLRLLAGKRSVDVSISTDKETRFDPDRMKQVILNLFLNAVQHTHQAEGKIRISLEDDPDGIVLCIEDNGPGIPESHLSHIFERFYRVDTARTRKTGGSGLGLAITKSIVESHGGTIRCESKVGEGTAFIVRLPSSQAQKAAADLAGK